MRSGNGPDPAAARVLLQVVAANPAASCRWSRVTGMSKKLHKLNEPGLWSGAERERMFKRDWCEGRISA
ncbi:hypothetical protein CHELA40_15410 [Chelatococcus asaccharovorans]|nr:hypothetical protein CHELA17_60207 [Chelatococcus asaccharovorans]CAH1682431.1 hypothetical protein CHELA40_15410 [Chelatococcus asaccharovorans]